MDDLFVGKKFRKGEMIGKIGDYPVNGDWPSHLHFQIINNMMGKEGDFPGVCSKEDRDAFLEICPNPNLILNIKDLD